MNSSRVMKSSLSVSNFSNLAFAPVLVRGSRGEFLQVQFAVVVEVTRVKARDKALGIGGRRDGGFRTHHSIKPFQGSSC